MSDSGNDPFAKLRAKKRKPVDQGPRPVWFERLGRGPRGKVLTDLHNVIIAFQADASMSGVLAFDEMRRTAMILKEPPLSPDLKPAPPPPRQLTDDDVGRLQDWLQFMGLRAVGRETVGQAAHIIARDYRFHPVRDWLASLEWDGTERLSDLLPAYFGAEHGAYVEAIGRMFLISMVARILQPGCKAEHMPILEGPQGILKSTACRILAGAEYFSDDLPDIHTKDAKQHLRGKWLIEVSELVTFNRADAESWKAFLSRQTEKYRVPYGKEDVEEDRQCVFVGTVNPKGGYLRDETGGRRFWPVKCGTINLEALERDRAQLFAEAVERLHHGEHWWPDASLEAAHIKSQQDARFEPDVWQGIIADYLSGKGKTTIMEIAVEVLGFRKPEQDLGRFGGIVNVTPITKLGTSETRRIAGVLVAEGWEQRHSNSARWWEPKNGSVSV